MPPAADAELSLCRHRSRWFVVFAAVWALVIIARMSQIMIFDQEKHLADISRESWHRGMIPPQRGRILDSSGFPLAWSMRDIQLHWAISSEPAAAWRAWAALTAIPDLPIRLTAETLPSLFGKTVTVIPNISAENARVIHELCKAEPSFTLVSRFVRHQAGPPALRRLLGHTTQRNGIEIGLNGLERTHDSVLRGRPGMYRVMLDNQGEWIMETWELVQDMQAGYDVFLPRQTTD
ncbi:MAG: hypothetical protein RRC34_14990 [Lentisphaeria bacterium]|nr:hypothetical protein [Lentisphaeria bacterium]